jgi:selenocysteine lyase/cysteine desulfurase
LARWPSATFSRLAGWKGIVHLKSDAKRLAGARHASRLLLTNRTSQLMRFAARLLFGPCRNVLITDLTWPSYEQILTRQARKSGNRVTRVRIREAVLRGRLSAGELISDMSAAFSSTAVTVSFFPQSTTAESGCRWKSWSTRFAGGRSCDSS